MKNFKLREQDYKAMQGMSEKQAGQVFIIGFPKRTNVRANRCP